MRGGAGRGAGGLGYDRSHEIASALVYDLREGRGLTPLLTGGRKVGGRDLPRRTAAALYEFVTAHYRHASTPRAGS